MRSSSHKFEGYIIPPSLPTTAWGGGEGGREALIVPLCTGMTERFFCALEAEFGEVFFSHLAGYISATKYGLTEMELLDVMSCDQQVRTKLRGLERSFNGTG